MDLLDLKVNILFLKSIEDKQLSCWIVLVLCWIVLQLLALPELHFYHLSFPFSSPLSSSLLLAFQPVPFGFSQEDFSLKLFPLGKNKKDLDEMQKEDDKEDGVDDKDEEGDKDEQKAGDHSNKGLISEFA